MAKYHVPALEKGLDILEALSDADAPLSLKDLAHRLQRNGNELFRMVTCLERRGYIIRDEVHGRYSLTLKLYQLAHTHSPVEKLVQAATRPMHELSARVGESCHLTGLSRGHIVVLARAGGPKPIRLSVEVGARFPACRTVSGRMLLSQLAPHELSAHLAGDPVYRRMHAKERADWHARLDRVRKQGYATAENETIVGVRDAAVLVGNPKVAVMAALAVPSLTRAQPQANGKSLLVSMQRTALQITKAVELTP